MTAIQLVVTVIANEDRPGIKQIIVGDQVLFEGGSEKVLQAEARVLVPYHVHFEEPRLACIWRDERR